MLADIFGDKVLTALKQTDPLGYLDLEREFEAAKRSIKSKESKQQLVNLTIPLTSLDNLSKLSQEKYSVCLRLLSVFKQNINV